VSDIPTDYREQLDLRAVIASIDRNRAETQKLYAEGRKFNRDWWIVPLTVLGAIIAAITARLPEILNALGWAHT
jgi:hypothetical protein